MTNLAEIYPENRIVIREVGMRDGLQLAKGFPSTAGKVEWLKKEFDAGIRHFEAGSYLPPARYPQFADVQAVVDAIGQMEGAHGIALAINRRGQTDALAGGVGELSCVLSATEEHNQANARCSRQQSLDGIKATVEMRDSSENKPLISVGIAMSFGCSITGSVDPEEVLRLAEQCLEMGVEIIGVADTVGYAGPRQVHDLCRSMSRLCSDRPYVVHLHDTRGMAIANAAAALDAGARIFDGSLGGLGGCPFAPGATGNIVIEDLVFLCQTSGFDTGIDLEKLISVRDVLEREMPDDPLHGAVAVAGMPKATIPEAA